MLNNERIPWFGHLRIDGKKGKTREQWKHGARKNISRKYRIEYDGRDLKINNSGIPNKMLEPTAQNNGWIGVRNSMVRNYSIG